MKNCKTFGSKRLEYNLDIIPAYSTANSTQTLRITGVLDYAHCPEFQILENTTLRKLDLFSSSGAGRETPTVLCPWTSD
jgi:hypothetical protein